jgi:hypothetical protein
MFKNYLAEWCVDAPSRRRLNRGECEKSCKMRENTYLLFPFNFFRKPIMAKGQQKTNKETKKPKKDTSPPKLISSEPVRATVTTTVIPRGKEKNKA